jgi:hypothetical protein
MWIPVGSPRCYVDRECPEMDPDDMCPTTAYLCNHMAAPHTFIAQSYVQFSNNLDALVPSSVSTFISSSIFYVSL